MPDHIPTRQNRDGTHRRNVMNRSDRSCVRPLSSHYSWGQCRLRLIRLWSRRRWWCSKFLLRHYGRGRRHWEGLAVRRWAGGAAGKFIDAKPWRITSSFECVCVLDICEPVVTELTQVSETQQNMCLLSCEILWKYLMWCRKYIHWWDLQSSLERCYIMAEMLNQSDWEWDPVICFSASLVSTAS